MYKLIRLTEHMEINIFGNNVSGRQWCSSVCQKRWLLHTDRNSKFWVKCWMCQRPPIRLCPYHIFPVLDTFTHRTLECTRSWCFCLDVYEHKCSPSRTGKEVPLCLTCFTSWHRKVPLTHPALAKCVSGTFLCQNICKENAHKIHNKDRLHSKFN